MDHRFPGIVEETAISAALRKHLLLEPFGILASGPGVGIVYPSGIDREAKGR